MIADLLSGLGHANLALAAAALGVAGLRRPVRRAFGARAAYGLWLAVPLAALAVLLPQPAAPTLLSPVAASVEAVVVQAAPAGFDWSALAQPALFGLWALGALAAAGVLAVRQTRFLAEARAGRAGPAVVGTLRPRIVLPADFETRFADDEQAVILSHERAHLAAGDAGVNAIAAAGQCLCWFNPLAHLAAHLMRIDQELACDAAVLAAHPQARKLYAAALLKTQLTPQPLPLGCHWPSAATHPLKERIVMLKSPLPGRARRIAGAAVVALAVASAGAVSWAAQTSKMIGLNGDAAVWAARQPTPREVGGQPVEVAYHIVFLKNGRPIVKRSLFGRFGQELSVEVPNLMRVAVAAQPPGADGRSQTSARMAAFQDGAWRPAKEMSMGAFLNQTPSFEYSVLGTPYRFVVMPRGTAPVKRPPPGPTVTQPDWARKPTAAELVEDYPAVAMQAHVEGQATIDCRVAADGTLADCQVLKETPEGVGFGAAAIAMSEHFQMKPTSRDGQPVAGGQVRIPIRFRLPGPPAA